MAPSAFRTGAASDAQVAQLVEHMTENHGVGGSIPARGIELAANAAHAYTHRQADIAHCHEMPARQKLPRPDISEKKNRRGRT
jgi:hypothetical protein